MYQTVRHLLRSGTQRDRIWWLRLDHPLFMSVRLDVLVRAVIHQTNAGPTRPVFLCVDELAYGRDWDLWLKTFYDERWPIRLVGTSSSTAALRDRRLESGVGRWEEQYLSPYLLSEYLDLHGIAPPIAVKGSMGETLAQALNNSPSLDGIAAHRRAFLLTGGFPELLLAIGQRDAGEADRLLSSQRTLRTDAIERAIYKDIPQAFRIDDPLMLERLLYTLAAQVTGILSPTSICQSLDGISQPTFDRYLTYLERAFLVFTLPNYSATEEARQRRGRKVYFVDSAIRNAALQRGTAPLSNQQEMGLLIENMAAGHLHALGQQAQVRVYHWRDGNDEVDLVYDDPREPLVFEIAGSPSHRRRGLHTFIDRYPRFKDSGFLVAPDAIPCPPSRTLDGIGTIPLDLFLLVVAAQAETTLRHRLDSESATARSTSA